MKPQIKLILLMMVFLISNPCLQSQTLNWGNLQKNQKHILSAKAGWEYSSVAGLGYGYKLNGHLPIILQGDFSLPLGEDLLDDFKTKIGASCDLYRFRDFHFILNISGVFRKYQSEYVRMLNFGSDFSGVVGYYKSRWFLSGEAGFDKAIVTHFKHTDEYRKIYPDVQDGWYEPATGGNFYYGLQTGYSFDRTDITLKAGKIINEDFHSESMAPYYLLLGVNFKFEGR